MRPKENFESKPATEDHNQNHGAFIFFREDGSAVSYTLSDELELRLTGDVELIADVYQFNVSNIVLDVRDICFHLKW